MARSQEYAASPARNPSLFSSLLIISTLSSHILAANSQPPPAAAFHNVVAPGVAAAPPPPDDRKHYNINQRAQPPREQPPPAPYTPLVTPAPSALPDDEALRNQGFRQETYYACVTAASGQTHCGWHTPVLKQDKKGSAAAVPGRATDPRIVAGVVVVLAGVFAVGMM